MYLSEATDGGRDSGAPFWNHENLSERTKPGVPGVTRYQIRDFRGIYVKANEAFRPRRCMYQKRHLEGATPARRFGVTKMSSKIGNRSRPPLVIGS
jgi:hypothetical protein